jgi:hypothetical protein
LNGLLCSIDGGKYVESQCPPVAPNEYLAGLDGLAQADVVPCIGADVAHRGEAGLQRPPRMAHRQHRPEAVVELQAGVAAVGRIAVQMHVHVDQPGQQGHARQVHARGAGRHRGLGAPHFDDAPAAHQHPGPLDHAPAAHVEHARGGDPHAVRGVLRLRRDRHEGSQRKDACEYGAAPVHSVLSAAGEARV